MSKGTTIVLILIAVAAIAFMAMTFDADVEGGALPDASVSVTQTEEGNMPKYEVIQTEEGNMPKYDVDGEMTGGEMPSVDVDAPEVDVQTEERTIEVPTGVDVEPADGANAQ